MNHGKSGSGNYFHKKLEPLILRDRYFVLNTFIIVCIGVFLNLFFSNQVFESFAVGLYIVHVLNLSRKKIHGS